MAETQIEWTDATWNPVAGCSIISAGCTNCYAMEMAKRLQLMGVEKYDGLTRRNGKRTIWNGIVREDRVALDIPLRWKKPKKIFVNSMSDLFHEGVPDDYIAKVGRVMLAANWHTYQVLTKRADRMAALLQGKLRKAAQAAHIWWGVSVENRQHGLPRVAKLRAAKPAAAFLSVEPLLEDLGKVDLRGIQWVIVGGESGPGARPIEAAWVRNIRTECR